MQVPASAAHRNYDKRPVMDVPGDHPAWSGREAWTAITAHAAGGTIVVDAYPASDVQALGAVAHEALPRAEVIDVEREAALDPDRIQSLLERNLTADRVFGLVSHHRLEEFYDASRLRALAERVSSAEHQCVLVGWGASLVPLAPSALVLADLARAEIQRRYRAGAGNWRADNGDQDALAKFKRGYFVEWRVADRHKTGLLERADFVLDANGPLETAPMTTGDALREGLRSAVHRPFRLAPFFDPGVWGGQWMKEVCGLDPEQDNYAWCFDCVPEENSLLLAVGDQVLEIPAIDLVLSHPRELLGERTFARFGAEFPIRFDFLDTMDGGNLSLQVHPLTEYIKETFGMTFTQDESYYLLDAAEDARVYLGLRTDADPEEMVSRLRSADAGESSFPAERFVNTFPARKHDHFAIPAGTVHASGAGSMVLEISATPYIFTFKMWDWGRVGLDGAPRPIHLEHALASVQWDRDTEWTRQQLVDRVVPIAEGPGWREERTGLHELEFIEVRRHWFTDAVDHDTEGTVNVLNLVEGPEAVVESPHGAFAPFVVHYAETFIVPAEVGAYRIRPHGVGEGVQHATVKAFVDGTAARAS
ncbi:class I mannose-6-phosphate isomerase [Brachybacterium sacelli]